MATAVNRKQFDRAFRSPCQPLDASRLVEQVARERLARLANLLGMARKSAHFVAGSNAVLDVLARKQPLAVIILAGDISPQIGEKISWKAGQQGVLITKLFDKTELGRILGRAERSVVGLPVGQLADAFIGDLHRYQDISGES
jgi:ribosomal protein L7Ae-like RNA K-turn-binding protein